MANLLMALLNKLAEQDWPTRPERRVRCRRRSRSCCRKSRWLFLIVVASFLALSLWGYHQADPGWSHAVRQQRCTIRPGAAAPGWPT
jgi:hypothetical protein